MAEPTPQNDFDSAQGILKAYYRELARRMAVEIITNREDFESASDFDPLTGQVIEKYSIQLQQLCGVFSNLKQFTSREKPKGAEPLGIDEFRCFGCGGVIRHEDASCRVCGWTWR